MKIFAVGMNYALHNKEVKNTLLQKSVSTTDDRDPVIFTKADSALLKDGKPFAVFQHRILPVSGTGADNQHPLAACTGKHGRNLPITLLFEPD